MSFLSENFSEDMRDLSLVSVLKTKNDIGEMVDTEPSPISFRGIIMRVSPSSSYLIQNNIPIEEASHSLRLEIGILIKRDDIIIDDGKRYTVKHVGMQDDFGGKEDHQLIYLKYYE